MKKYMKKIIIGFANLGVCSSMVAILNAPTQHQSINANKEKGPFDRKYEIHLNSLTTTKFSNFENGKYSYPSTTILTYINDFASPGLRLKFRMKEKGDWYSFLDVTIGKNPFTFGTKFNFNKFKNFLAEESKKGEDININFNVKYAFLAHDHYNISYYYNNINYLY